MATSQRRLAADLKLSQMTVCRALRGDSGVSLDVRCRVLRRARECGYPLAARLRRNHMQLEHVVCSIVEIQPGRDAGDFNARLLAGIEQGGREAGAELMHYGSIPWRGGDQDGLGNEWPRVVTRRQVDGVVHLFGGDLEHRPRYACPVPHVSIFFPIDEASDVATVDNMGGGRLIGDHLGKLGHRRVAFIGTITPLAEERLLGLRAGLNAHGGAIPDALVSVAKHVGTPDTVDPLLDAILPPDCRAPADVRERFTAIAVYNDYMATEVIAQLGKRGLRVPEDVSVTGFDGVTPADYAGPALTSMTIPLEDLGREAARLLYWRLDFPTAPQRTLMLRTTLAAGKTAAPVAEGSAPGRPA